MEPLNGEDTISNQFESVTSLPEALGYSELNLTRPKRYLIDKILKWLNERCTREVNFICLHGQTITDIRTPLREKALEFYQAPDHGARLWLRPGPLRTTLAYLDNKEG